MTNKKYIILLLLIIFIIVAIVLTLLIFSIKEANGEYAENGIDGSEYKEIEEEVSRTMFYSISKCINDKIDKNYYYTKEIYRLNKDEGFVYFIYGALENKSKYYLLYLDDINTTYELNEIQEEEYNNIKKGIVADKYKQKKEIIKADNNVFEFINVTEEEIANQYLNIIKNLIIYQPEQLYNILDIEYKEKNFTNIEMFKQFINKNMNKFESIELNSYSKYLQDEKVEYICTSKTGESYIIKEETIKGYTIVLNNFTY